MSRTQRTSVHWSVTTAAARRRDGRPATRGRASLPRRHGLAIGALLVTILLGWIAALPVAASVAPPQRADAVDPAAPGVLRGATAGTTTPATAVTVDKPAGTATNDLLLAAISINEIPTVTAPAGWTHLRTETNGSAMRQALYWKVATGSEPASYTWTFGSPVDSSAAAIAAYSGVDTSTFTCFSGRKTASNWRSGTHPTCSHGAPRAPVIVMRPSVTFGKGS